MNSFNFRAFFRFFVSSKLFSVPFIDILAVFLNLPQINRFIVFPQARFKINFRDFSGIFGEKLIKRNTNRKLSDNMGRSEAKNRK